MARNQEQFAREIREAAEPVSVEPTEPTQATDDHESDQTGTDAPDPKAPDIPAAEAEKPPEPKGAKDLLAKIDAEIPDLYDTKIPGTDITFGQAKDAAPDLADISRLKLDLEGQRDELVTQQTTERTQVEALLNRLTAQFGEEALRQAAGHIDQDIADTQQAQRDELIRWRPELADPDAYETATKQITELGTKYGLPAQAMGTAVPGLKRAFLRLHQLESYLDTLRKPVEPPKQAKAQPNVQAVPKATPKPRTHSHNRGLDAFKRQFE